MDDTMIQEPQPEQKEEFVKQLVDACIHLIYRFVYFLFILPFDIWKKAIIRLSKQRKEKSLDLIAIKSEFPFLSWLKRFIFDFLIDGLTAIIWIIGFIFTIVIMFVGSGEFDMDSVFLNILLFLVMLYNVYWMPVYLAIIRDMLTICVVMPLRWLVSFFRRPAKTYDLTHVGSIKKD